MTGVDEGVRTSADNSLETLPGADYVRALFHVTANADPGTLPRLVEPFAKMGLTPTRVHASRESGDGSEQNIDLRLNEISARDAQLVETMLRGVVGVRRVIAVTECD